METTNAPPRPGQAWLFVFAHQDDEMTIAPWVRRAAQTGSIFCVFLTDGGTFAQPKVRERESLAVLARLGVAAERVRFLGGAGGAPDGALAEHIASASAAGWSALEGVKIDAIACPAWEGGHQDHDAAHLIAQSWARRLGVGVWEYSLYHAHRAGLAPFRVMTLIEEEGEERATTSITWQDRIEGLATLISYPSQWRSMVGLYAPIATIYGLRQEMALRRAPAARVRNRPHAGALLYERRRKYSYAQFERATAAFREAHVLAPAEGA